MDWFTVYCLQFTVYSFLRSVGAQASELGVPFTVSCAPWVLRRASSESSLPFSWRIGLGNKKQEKPAASVKPKNDYEAFFCILIC